MVSTVSPKANATPRNPIPRDGKPAARTAAPQPPKVSQKVPKQFGRGTSRHVHVFPPLAANSPDLRCLGNRKRRTWRAGTAQFSEINVLPPVLLRLVPQARHSEPAMHLRQ